MYAGDIALLIKRVNKRKVVTEDDETDIECIIQIKVPPELREASFIDVQTG
ncbi:hypothetical protein [Photorhabdus heterorhabditis]|uniref:hypothetical protein n=1 Tax=Photorhabdus heterorhabditis TaxID=880156 RepID=UPI000B1B8FA0|nr:hypothetical protein [Photorhabdus heterorhabditis]